jgi:sulfide:quinone oxidoreductase
MIYTRLSAQLAAAPQVRPEDLREIAASGFVGLVNNRPDAEAPDQPSSADLGAAASQVGLAYWHIPVVPGAMTEKEVSAFAAALRAADGPVLAFCRTGKRSAALWKTSQALA